MFLYQDILNNFMKRAPLLILFLLILSPLSLADGLEVREGESDLHITVELPRTVDPLYLNPEIFLCRDGCEPVDIKSLSYSGGKEIDFFITPGESGSYDLMIFLTINGRRVSYQRKIETRKDYEKEEVVKEQMGVTGNITRNASSPIFIFGGLALFLFLSLFKPEKSFIKTRFFKLFKTETRVLIVFIFSFLIFASVTHEFFHIFTAGIFNCPAVLESFIPVYSPTSVSLSCEITSIQSILILSAGLIGNLMLGVLFYLLSILKKNQTLLFSTISLAFFSSSFFYLFYTTGDIHNIMKILYITLPQFYLDIAGISLILTSFYLFFRRHIIKTTARCPDTTGICKPVV